MNRRLWQAWSVAVTLATCSTACDVKVGDEGVSVDFAAGRATDEWVRTYQLEPGGRLEIVNVNGQIEASPSSGTQVEVRAIREVRSHSEEASQKRLREATMREEVTPDRVVVQPPQELEQRRGFGRERFSIRYDVRIPPGLDVTLKTQNGEVRLQNIQGNRIVASSTNGGITARGITGAIEASTVNGGIQIDLERVTGDTRVITVNGGIRLTLDDDVNAELEATVVNGRVSVQEGLGIVGDDQSRQRVSGRLGSGGPRLVVQTTNGGVRIARRDGPGS